MDKKLITEMKRLAGLLNEDAVYEKDVLNLETLPDGNLKLTLGAEGRDTLETNPNADIGMLMDDARYIGIGWEYFDDLSYTGLGLTNAPAIGHNMIGPQEDGSYTYDVDSNLWWFPNYMVVDPKEELLKTGTLIFEDSGITRIEPEESEESN